MSKTVLAIVGVVLVLVVGVTGYLMTAEIPAPSQPISKTISNDRFPS